MSGDNSIPLVKLQCASWDQLRGLYERDIQKGQLFLTTRTPPTIGTRFKISLKLPSDSTVELTGRIAEHIGAGGYQGRGPGILLRLDALAYTSQWMIESSLNAAARSSGKPAVAAGNGAARTPAAKATAQPTKPTEEPTAKPTARPRSKPPTPANTAVAGEASLADGHDVIQAEGNLVDSLYDELKSLKELNPFQRLEVAYTATDEEVRAAFGKLTKKYHPDRFARYESTDVRKVGSEIFLLLRDAYTLLSTSERRHKTLAMIRAAEREAAAGSAPAGATPKQAEGKNPFEGLLEAKNYDAALNLAQLSLRKAPSDRKAKARVELCHGLRALDAGDRMEAAERLEATIELDPDNEYAVRGLTDLRRKATEARKGFLGRLLKQKR